MDSVGTAFELMRLELETTVENLNRIGSEHFRASRYAEAQDLIQMGTALEDFCKRVSSLEDEWRNDFSDLNSANEADEDHMPSTEETSRQILAHSKSSKTGLVVRFKDGTLISEKTAALTLVKALEYIGLDRVASVGVSVNNENIVSLEKSSKYQETKVGRYFIKTHSNTKQKKQNIEQICEKLGISVAVHVIE